MKRIAPTELPIVNVPELDGPHQLLWDAANYMERHGKAGPSVDGIGPNGEVCVIRAVCRAAEDRLTFGADAGAIDMFKNFVGKPVVVFSDNNDQATVVAALRGAALS